MDESETTNSNNPTVQSTEDSKCVEKIDWIEKMIERESTPKSLRTETQDEFCKRLGIPESTYKYNRGKKENKKRIAEIWLNEAFLEGNEVLAQLALKAKNGDMKAIELYIKFVLELAENLDVKSGGNTILIQVAREIANKYDIARDSKTDSTRLA